ncbi:MAG: helix-turn-helix transcriptional regulator [Oligoflexales bacterium]
MPEKVLVSHTDKPDVADELQRMLRIYLKSVRIERDWTQADLAKKLGCSKATIEKMEHRLKISTPVIYLMGLKPLADLRELSLAGFADALEGNTNELGDEDFFVRDIMQHISTLDYEAMIDLLALITSDKFDKFLSISKNLLQLSENEIDGLNHLCDLDKVDRQSLFHLVSSLKNLDKRVSK